MPDPARRLFLFDDNVRGVGGHFLELATLLAHGGRDAGFKPILIANRKFNAFSACDFSVHAVFRTHRMLRWSLGVDGKSRTTRDCLGRPDSGSLGENLLQRFRDLMTWRPQRPQVMVGDYARNIAAEIRDHKINSNDVIVINTCDDFALTAVARGLQLASPASPLSVHAVFHFAVADKGIQNDPRPARFGVQVNRAVEQFRSHRLHLHATSPQLADQIVAAGVRFPVTPIPYPTRLPVAGGTAQPPRVEPSSPESPNSSGSKTVDRPGESGCMPGRLRVMLAGLPRAEKGREAISEMILGIRDQLFNEDGYCLSMQMNETGWHRMIPDALHSQYQECVEATRHRIRSNLSHLSSRSTSRGPGDEIPPVDPPQGPFEVLTSNLNTNVYHRWLDSADIGLFLYAPDRYTARVSGVLLELMIRGTPVVVPDSCWLGDFVRQYNTILRAEGRSDSQGVFDQCGLVYAERREVPECLMAIHRSRARFRAAARDVAIRVARTHSGSNTIASMGIESRSAFRAKKAAA